MAERLQINFEYSSIEDRLLLRISEKENQGGGVEYRFWLTRRFVNVFIKATDKLIEDEVAGDIQVSPDAIEAMKENFNRRQHWQKPIFPPLMMLTQKITL